MELNKYTQQQKVQKKLSLLYDVYKYLLSACITAKIRTKSEFKYYYVETQ